MPFISPARSAFGVLSFGRIDSGSSALVIINNFPIKDSIGYFYINSLPQILTLNDPEKEAFETLWK